MESRIGSCGTPQALQDFWRAMSGTAQTRTRLSSHAPVGMCLTRYSARPDSPALHATFRPVTE